MHWQYRILICLGLGLLPGSAFALSISITQSPGSAPDPIIAHAVNDVRELLATACDCSVALNDQAADVHLMLPEIVPGADTVRTRFADGRDYPYLHYPAHHYRWLSRRQSGQVLLVLETPTAQGVANALYGLLQEQLGFRFVHPRQTIYPCFETWPLPDNFTFEGRPRFDKKGFHLHAMHPTELTEVLHNPAFPNGQALIREYLDWLARNQQNFFDFNLLETVQLNAWIPYAQDFNAYADERGILTSIDVSLHMVQQNAFKLVRFPPWTFESFSKQVRNNIDALVLAGFDMIDVEFSIAEFVGGLEGLRHRLREDVLAQLEQYPQVKLTGRQHVIKPEDELGKMGEKDYQMDDPERGVLIHTVMCYALTDARTPVYELDDFSHLLAALETENKVRETWYYPESAYWITFDNSVPMLLLPYLDARWRDIQTVEQMGIPGHVTFSSGWEWGYWMVDWSIARWSWSFTENGREKAQGPLDVAEDLWNQSGAARKFGDMLHHQKRELLEKNLLRWLCPSTIPDEFGGKVGKQFQPRPSIALESIYKDAPANWQDSLAIASRELKNFGRQQVQQAADFLNLSPKDGLEGQLALEVSRALKVTGMYALHQSAWYAALSEVVYGQREAAPALEECVALREFAQPLVTEMEAQYRYPVEWLGRPRKSYTAYQYGYLYPVSELHFWKRREEQLRQGKFGKPFFMNIFDPLRIGGLRK